MKKILLMIIALGFISAVNFETVAQKRATVRKTAKQKLVKCRVNGKIVYRKKCPTTRVENTETVPDLPITRMETPTNTTSGNGQGAGLGNGRGSGQGNGNGVGIGMGNGSGNTEQQTTIEPRSRVKSDKTTQGVVILSKPRAIYTDDARSNQIQGKVVLRVTFQANGTIGEVSVISGLSNGLTEQAKNAARQIRFVPAKRNGKPFTTTKAVEYTFTLY